MLPIDLSGKSSFNGMKHKKVQQGSTGTKPRFAGINTSQAHMSHHLYCKPQTGAMPLLSFFCFSFSKMIYDKRK